MKNGTVLDVYLADLELKQGKCMFDAAWLEEKAYNSLAGRAFYKDIIVPQMLLEHADVRSFRM